MDKAWSLIFVAGIFEIVWAVCMDCSEGFTVWYFAIPTIAFLIVSTVLLAKALNAGLPVGTAYAVWTGIGAVGTIIVSVILGNESFSVLSVLFLAMIVRGIIGLQATSKKEED